VCARQITSLCSWDEPKRAVAFCSVSTSLLSSPFSLPLAFLSLASACRSCRALTSLLTQPRPPPITFFYGCHALVHHRLYSRTLTTFHRTLHTSTYNAIAPHIFLMSPQDIGASGTLHIWNQIHSRLFGPSILSLTLDTVCIEV
jgi:hypothetical protein